MLLFRRNKRFYAGYAPGTNLFYAFVANCCYAISPKGRKAIVPKEQLATIAFLPKGGMANCSSFKIGTPLTSRDEPVLVLRKHGTLLSILLFRRNKRGSPRAPMSIDKRVAQQLPRAPMSIDKARSAPLKKNGY